MSFYVLTPKQSFGPKTNLKNSPKGPKHLKRIPKTKSQKTKKVTK